MFDVRYVAQSAALKKHLRNPSRKWLVKVNVKTHSHTLTSVVHTRDEYA